jgi:hypothetical protein
MKRLLFLLIFGGLVSLCFIFTPSCTKNVSTTVYDTVTKINNDTTIFRDTTINRDTVYVTSSKNPIIGLWVGIYTVAQLPAYDSFYYQYAIRPDSTVVSTSGGLGGNGAGRWRLVGTTFYIDSLTTMDGNNPENIQKIVCQYDSVNGVLSGTYTDIFGTNSNNGTINLHRIP